MTKLARIHFINEINCRNLNTVEHKRLKKPLSAKKIVLNIILFKYLFLGLVYFYKFLISPFLPHSCKFRPTCSSYMIDAINKHGLVFGIFMGIERIFRCNPFNVGGVDPVPDSIGDIKWLY